MDPSEPHAGNGSMREASAALVGLFGTRMELLGLELREEGLHLQRVLVLGIVAAFVLGAALVLAGVLVAAAFWDDHRLVALAVVASLYGVVGAALLIRLRSWVRERPRPFDATLQELEADMRTLRESSGDARS